MSPFAQQAPQAVLFDFDGTLVDSAPSLAVAVDRTLEALGRAPVGLDNVRNWVGNGAFKLLQRAIAGNHERRPRPDPELMEQAFDTFMTFYGEQPELGTRLYPGVQESLDTLRDRGVPMGIVTNKPERFMPPLLTTYGLTDYFQVVVGGDTLAEKKPHPAPLQHAAQRLGVDPLRCLMVGDSVTDVRAARAAGMVVACVSYGYNHGEPIEDAGADWTVDSLTELL